MTDPLEQTARRIAERGRESLLERLRSAFQQTAAAHAHVVELDADQLERMVRQAADRADGVLWHRALARVATDELGIGLGEALEHPAVARAQEIVGASSSEASQAPHDAARDEGEQKQQLEPTSSESNELAPEAILLAAVHLDGIENLRRNEGNLELRFSDAGLDIVSTEGGNALARLRWEEIQALDMPRHGGLRRRRRTPPQLLVRTDRGEVSFAVPALTEEELQTHLAPMLARARGAQGSD